MIIFFFFFFYEKKPIENDSHVPTQQCNHNSCSSDHRSGSPFRGNASSRKSAAPPPAWGGKKAAPASVQKDSSRVCRHPVRLQKSHPAWRAGGGKGGSGGRKLTSTHRGWRGDRCDRNASGQRYVAPGSRTTPQKREGPVGKAPKRSPNSTSVRLFSRRWRGSSRSANRWRSWRRCSWKACSTQPQRRFCGKWRSGSTRKFSRRLTPSESAAHTRRGSAATVTIAAISTLTKKVWGRLGISCRRSIRRGRSPLWRRLSSLDTVWGRPSTETSCVTAQAPAATSEVVRGRHGTRCVEEAYEVEEAVTLLLRASLMRAKVFLARDPRQGKAPQTFTLGLSIKVNGQEFSATCMEDLFRMVTREDPEWGTWKEGADSSVPEGYACCTPPRRTRSMLWASSSDWPTTRTCWRRTRNTKRNDSACLVATTGTRWSVRNFARRCSRCEIEIQALKAAIWKWDHHSGSRWRARSAEQPRESHLLRRCAQDALVHEIPRGRGSIRGPRRYCPTITVDESDHLSRAPARRDVVPGSRRARVRRRKRAEGKDQGGKKAPRASPTAPPTRSPVLTVDDE